ncbi:MAG: hypothetical protein HW416_3455 [Chloroflexi bacterium]|nr:hypothetical protein [Chloroflexota bacterium]
MLVLQPVRRGPQMAGDKPPAYRIRLNVVTVVNVVTYPLSPIRAYQRRVNVAPKESLA